jgi:hypothetical protein
VSEASEYESQALTTLCREVLAAAERGMQQQDPALVAAVIADLIPFAVIELNPVTIRVFWTSATLGHAQEAYREPASAECAHLVEDLVTRGVAQHPPDAAVSERVDGVTMANVELLVQPYAGEIEAVLVPVGDDFRTGVPLFRLVGGPQPAG